MRSVCVLLASVATVTCYSQIMAQTINVKDLAQNGVVLVPSTAPDFALQLQAAIGNPAPSASALIPYSVILKNLSGRVIRGYGLGGYALIRTG
jgi:hypothetical protein